MEKQTTSVSPAFRWASGPAGRVLVCDTLAAHASHLFTTRELSFRSDAAATDDGGLATAMFVDAGSVVRVRQVHGRTVAVVRAGDRWPEPLPADAIISFDRDRAIAVPWPICVPILSPTSIDASVAAIHAGWRGTAAAVTQATIETMASLGISPADSCGRPSAPSIGPCCYQVDSKGPGFVSLDDAPTRRLVRGRRRSSAGGSTSGRPMSLQVVSAGCRATRPFTSPGCDTADHLDRVFFVSQGRSRHGRMVAAIRFAPRAG